MLAQMYDSVKIHEGILTGWSSFQGNARKQSYPWKLLM